ncbi:MAG: ABC transporter permease [Deltaproteobacteria bacterium]|nr:MAG: ABC transporter permease [Deltaproteobacteria bacterium]
MAVAVFADFLASDKPILLSLDGKVYVFPNVFDPPELRIYDNLRLLDAMDEEDWAVFPPILYGYNTHDLSAVLQPPGGDHLLGTDPVGRDVLARMIHGSRVSLAVGFLAVAIMVAVGVLLGALAGYYGGWVDGIIMRVVEVFLSLPTFLVLVTMLAVIAPEGWGAVVAMMVVIGLTRWTGVARLIRGEILKVKTQEYVEASRALGGSDARIIFRHIVPNSISPVLVSATFGVASAILIESALSFLGFGIPADMASWGGVLTEARRHVDAWWLAVFPGFAIFVTVTAYNLMGEGLRDAIDPKLKT